MKPDPIHLNATGPRERFTELGTKILSVSKEEIDKREKQWRKARRKKAKR